MPMPTARLDPHVQQRPLSERGRREFLDADGRCTACGADADGMVPHVKPDDPKWLCCPGFSALWTLPDDWNGIEAVPHE